MTEKTVSIWFDKEGDFLEVVWKAETGHFVKTRDERVMAKVDSEGKVIGFHVLAVSTMDRPVSLIMEDQVQVNQENRNGSVQ